MNLAGEFEHNPMFPIIHWKGDWGTSIKGEASTAWGRRATQHMFGFQFSENFDLIRKYTAK